MGPGLRKTLADVISLLILALMAVLAFWPIAFGDKVPIATDSIYFHSPWAESRPAGLDKPNNPFATDQANQYYPWYMFISECSHKGKSLLWNAYENCGMPFLALWRTRCLSPFTIPFYLIPPASALQMSILLKLIVAGWCAYYAARKLGFNTSLAFLVSVAFELSAHIYLWSGWPISDVVPWLPLLVLFAERIVLGQSYQWPTGAIIICIMLLGGDPESVIAAVLFVLVFVVIRMMLLRKDSPPTRVQILSISVAIILGICLAGIQIVPYLEYLHESADIQDKGFQEVLQISDLATWLLPHLSGKDPKIIERDGFHIASHTLGLIHVGIIQVLSLWLWFGIRRFVHLAQRRRVESLLFSALFLAFIPFLFGAPIRNTWISSIFSVRNLFIGIPFAFAVCTASAAEEWVELTPKECGASIKRLFLILPVLITLLVLTLLVPFYFSEVRPEALSIQITVSLVIVIAFFTIISITLFKPSVSVLGYTLALLIFMNLLYAFSPGITYQNKADIFPDTPFITSLRELEGRVVGSSDLKKWPLSGNRIEQFYGPSGYLLKRHTEFNKGLEENPYLICRTGSSSLILTKSDIQGSFAPMRNKLKIRRVFPSGAILFDGLEMNTKAWMTYDARLVEEFDSRMLSYDQPPLIEDLTEPKNASGIDAEVSIIESDIDGGTSLRVSNSTAGILVLADSWYPGWHAKVDGKEVNIGKVDGIFRGINVESGDHEIEFYYDPLSLKVGIGITIAAAIVTVCGFINIILRRFIKSGIEQE